MSGSIREWFAKAIVKHDKNRGTNLNSTTQGQFVQILEFHTRRTAEDPRAQIVATVADKTHRFKVRFDVNETDDFERKQASLGDLAEPLTAHLRAVVDLTVIKFVLLPPKVTDKYQVHLPEVVLDVMKFNIISGGPNETVYFPEARFIDKRDAAVATVLHAWYAGSDKRKEVEAEVAEKWAQRVQARPEADAKSSTAPSKHPQEGGRYGNYNIVARDLPGDHDATLEQQAEFKSITFFALDVVERLQEEEAAEQGAQDAAVVDQSAPQRLDSPRTQVNSPVASDRAAQAEDSEEETLIHWSPSPSPQEPARSPQHEADVKSSPGGSSSSQAESSPVKASSSASRLTSKPATSSSTNRVPSHQTNLSQQRERSSSDSNVTEFDVTLPFSQESKFSRSKASPSASERAPALVHAVSSVMTLAASSHPDHSQRQVPLPSSDDDIDPEADLSLPLRPQYSKADPRRLIDPPVMVIDDATQSQSKEGTQESAEGGRSDTSSRSQQTFSLANKYAPHDGTRTSQRDTHVLVPDSDREVAQGGKEVTPSPPSPVQNRKGSTQSQSASERRKSAARESGRLTSEERALCAELHLLPEQMLIIKSKMSGGKGVLTRDEPKSSSIDDPGGTKRKRETVNPPAEPLVDTLGEGTSMEADDEATLPEAPPTKRPRSSKNLSEASVLGSTSGSQSQPPRAFAAIRASIEKVRDIFKTSPVASGAVTAHSSPTKPSSSHASAPNLLARLIPGPRSRDDSSSEPEADGIEFQARTTPAAAIASSSRLILEPKLRAESRAEPEPELNARERNPRATPTAAIASSSRLTGARENNSSEQEPGRNRASRATPAAGEPSSSKLAGSQDERETPVLNLERDDEAAKSSRRRKSVSFGVETPTLRPIPRVQGRPNGSERDKLKASQKQQGIKFGSTPRNGTQLNGKNKTPRVIGGDVTSDEGEAPAYLRDELGRKPSITFGSVTSRTRTLAPSATPTTKQVKQKGIKDEIRLELTPENGLGQIDVQGILFRLHGSPL